LVSGKHSTVHVVLAYNLLVIYRGNVAPVDDNVPRINWETENIQLNQDTV